MKVLMWIEIEAINVEKQGNELWTVSFSKSQLACTLRRDHKIILVRRKLWSGKKGV